MKKRKKGPGAAFHCLAGAFPRGSHIHAANPRGPITIGVAEEDA